MLLLGFNLTVLTVVLTRGGLDSSHNGPSASAPRPDAAPGVASGVAPQAAAPQRTAALDSAPESPAADRGACRRGRTHFSPLDGRRPPLRCMHPRYRSLRERIRPNDGAAATKSRDVGPAGTA